MDDEQPADEPMTGGMNGSVAATAIGEVTGDIGRMGCRTNE
jgi:hypothetical protein